MLDEEGVDEGDRDRAQEGAGHERTPVEDVAAHELGEDPDRDRLLLGRREEDEGVEVLLSVPYKRAFAAPLSGVSRATRQTLPLEVAAVERRIARRPTDDQPQRIAAVQRGNGALALDVRQSRELAIELIRRQRGGL